jgi:hypothetical protein
MMKGRAVSHRARHRRQWAARSGDGAHAGSLWRCTMSVTPTPSKNRRFRVAVEARVPVTIRRVRGGLLCWRSTEEEVQEAHEGADRLKSSQ